MFKIFAFLIGLLLATPSYAQTFPADAKIRVSSTLVTNDVNPITIKTTGGTIYSVDAFNNGTAIVYIKIYNASQVTCGTGIPLARYMVPFGASSAGGGFNVSNINGDAYAFGMVMCITAGIADNDVSPPPANTYIVNVHFK